MALAYRIVSVGNPEAIVVVRFRCYLASTALCLSTASAPAAAQRAAPVHAGTGTEIVLLGTAAGPLLRADRSEPATLLIVNDRRYLIDCGIGTARRLLEAKVASETIKTIFLTHLHADHDLGLVDVLANDFQNHDLDSGRTISIYGPRQTKALVDAAWRFISIPYEVFAAEGGGPRGGVPASAPFAVHEIDTGVVYRDDRIRVVAVENSHYSLMPAASRAVMKSYSYRFETPQGVIVFTGDTGPSEAVERLAQHADVLVSEVSDFAAVGVFVDRMARQNHWSPQRTQTFKAHLTDDHLDLKDVGGMATRAHVGAVVLYHMDPSDPAAYVTTVSKYFSGPVFAGADLERFCLSAPASHASPAVFKQCQ